MKKNLAANLCAECSGAIQLSQDEILRASAAVDADPGDLVSRARLIGYYSTRILDPLVQQIRDRHIHWMIDNHPETFLGPAGGIIRSVSPLGYQVAREKWMAAVAARPNSSTVLRNAARFLWLSDPGLSKELLVRSVALEPSAESHSSLVLIYESELESSSGLVERYLLASFIVVECDRALSFGENAGLYKLTISLACAAVESADLSRAEQAARRVMNMQGVRGDGRDPFQGAYWANIVLGRVAMSRGNVEESASCLLRAADEDIPRIEDLRRPDFSLANALLRHQLYMPVLEYLSAVERSLGRSGSIVRALKQRVEGRRAPDLEEWARRYLKRARN